MIIETIVSTENETGDFNFAPLGVRYEGGQFSFIPFKTSRTYANLIRTRQGVINFTDDVYLFAGTMLENLVPEYDLSETVRGAVIRGAAGYREFRVTDVEDLDVKVRMRVEIVGEKDFPFSFSGFNRAKFAVIEALIAASRVHILSRNEVDSEIRRCGMIVEKTGTDREKLAMSVILRYLRNRPNNGHPPEDGPQ
jgi:hypothetical protein